MSEPDKETKGTSVNRWLDFETQVLGRLIYRNSNQHRGKDYLRSVKLTLRDLRRYNSQFRNFKEEKLRELRELKPFRKLYYKAISSVVQSSVRLLRVITHGYHVPLIIVLHF